MPKRNLKKLKINTMSSSLKMYLFFNFSIKNLLILFRRQKTKRNLLSKTFLWKENSWTWKHQKRMIFLSWKDSSLKKLRKQDNYWTLKKRKKLNCQLKESKLMSQWRRLYQKIKRQENKTKKRVLFWVKLKSSFNSPNPRQIKVHKEFTN